jgi:hypothetical protein
MLVFKQLFIFLKRTVPLTNIVMIKKYKSKTSIKKGLINGKYCKSCFVLLVLLVAAAKIHFEEQALVAGTQ